MPSEELQGEGAQRDWMARLARHYERTRRARPDDRLLLVFDLEGALLDAASGGPADGALQVARWFQLQPNTAVGISTLRDPSDRSATLGSLNAMGAAWRVSFSGEHLAMGRARGDGRASAAPHHLERFRAAGWGVFGWVDGEPASLAALAAAERASDLLLLHANGRPPAPGEGTALLPPGASSGGRFALASLVPEHGLPPGVELAWHGVNSLENLRELLASRVRWAEVDVRFDPERGEPVLQHDPLRPGQPDPLPLEGVLAALAEHGRAVKLDFKEAGPAVESALERVRRLGFRDADLWLNAQVEVLGEKTFRSLRERFPGAVVQCPADFLAPLVVTRPARAARIVTELAGFGIDRFSLGWGCTDLPGLVQWLAALGHDSNVYAVPDLEAFVRAALLLPRSLTADFDFPRWGYRGRGSGAAADRSTPAVPGG